MQGRGLGKWGRNDPNIVSHKNKRKKRKKNNIILEGRAILHIRICKQEPGLLVYISNSSYSRSGGQQAG
jgi:hypothetical protein